MIQITYNKKHWLALFLLTGFALLSACSNSSDSNDEGNQTSNDPTEKTLNGLGIKTSKTARKDDTGTELPDTYNPLGSTKSVTKIDEMFLIGISDPDNERGPVTLRKYTPDQNPTTGTTKTLYTPSNVTWASSAFKAATAADIDQDGYDETIIVYQDEQDQFIKLVIIDDEQAQFAETSAALLSVEPIDTDLTVTTGDLDGDQQLELILGIGQEDQAKLLFFQGNMQNGYQENKSLAKTFSATDTNRHIIVSVSTGNLDQDTGHEFAVVVNEYHGSGGSSRSYSNGTSRYFIYDDLSTALAEVESGFVEGRDDTQTILAAKVGEVALGDIDNDGIDEIVMGGLLSFTQGCAKDDMMLILIDDMAHSANKNALDRISVTSQKGTSPSGGGGCESSVNPRHIEYLYVHTLDIDGDQVAEIHLNGVIFDDIREGKPLTELAQINGGEFTHDSGNRGYAFRRSNTAVAVGDFTADGRDDIAVVVPMHDHMTIWGIQKSDNTFVEKHRETMDSYFATGGSIPTDPRPIIVATNVDKDSFIVEYAGEVEYKYVFTEPLLIAALAAPPCARNIGQNTEACTTTFGKGQSQTVEAEAAVTISASAHVGAKGGFELPIIKVGVEVEYEETISASVTAAIRGAYTVTKSYNYTTGPLEDTVVFTTVPYDQYTYRIVSHPNPDAVGKEFILSVPRDPITVQVERQFYNERVQDNTAKIDSSVFSHVVGNPSSYPSKTQLTSKYSGLDSDVKTVGINTGSTGVQIDVEQTVGGSVTMAVSWERTVKATAGGAMAGYSVGAELSSTLGYSVGNITSYSGSVGEINPNQFDANNQYSYGLYAYTMKNHASSQQFQVINYWVE